MQGDLTKKQVCEILNCSSSTFYKLLYLLPDPLPAYKLTDGPKAEWRVIYDELQAWRERRKSQSPVMRYQKAKPGPKPEPPARWQMVFPEKKKRKEA